MCWEGFVCLFFDKLFLFFGLLEWVDEIRNDDGGIKCLLDNLDFLK